MNIKELTLGQLDELKPYLNKEAAKPEQCKEGLSLHVGQKVIVRTYSAGVWYGLLTQKAGKEVILVNARRMWEWKCKKSISLSGVAIHGVDHSGSRIAGPVDSVWLEAIEILQLSDSAKQSIEGANECEAR